MPTLNFHAATLIHQAQKLVSTWRTHTVAQSVWHYADDLIMEAATHDFAAADAALTWLTYEYEAWNTAMADHYRAA